MLLYKGNLKMMDKIQCHFSASLIAQHILFCRPGFIHQENFKVTLPVINKAYTNSLVSVS